MAIYFTSFSITAGYHRLFAHRSYEAKPWLKAFFLFFGSSAFQGSLFDWASDHRVHHNKVDTPEDPYNINQGFWYAHIGWLFVNTIPGSIAHPAPDLAKDRMVLLQDKYYAPLAFFTGFILPTLLGAMVGYPLGGLLMGGFFRIFFTNHVTFFINSLAHTWGRKTYNDSVSARDSFIMAVLAVGEGYHNYHHAFAADYRNGVRWYHFDPAKWFIKTFSWLGVTYRLKTTPHFEILRARLRCEKQRLLQYGVPEDKTLSLAQKVEEAQNKFWKLYEEYQRGKKNLKASSYKRYLEIKSEMAMAKLEMKSSWRQWCLYYRIMLNGYVRAYAA